MKNFYQTLTIFVLLASVAVAQPTKEELLQLAPANYARALLSDNEGMQQSAILNVMRLKLEYPDINCDTVCIPLTQLVNESENQSIRFMAYIAGQYMKHPERFQWINKTTLEKQPEFFELFAEKVGQQVANR
jgi:hypothetical protein